MPGQTLCSSSEMISGPHLLVPKKVKDGHLVVFFSLSPYLCGCFIYFCRVWLFINPTDLFIDVFIDSSRLNKDLSFRPSEDKRVPVSFGLTNIAWWKNNKQSFSPLFF